MYETKVFNNFSLEYSDLKKKKLSIIVNLVNADVFYCCATPRHRNKSTHLE